MKTKIFALSTFFVIFLFLTLNTAWADDPISRSRSNRFHKYGVDNHREKNTFKSKSFVHPNKTQRPFERAERRAWADGRLTYREMRKLHQLKIKARRENYRWRHHKVPDHSVKKGHTYPSHHWSAFPKFTLHLSFSDPGTIFAGSIGVK